MLFNVQFLELVPNKPKLAKERVFIEELFSLFEEGLIKNFNKILRVKLYHNFLSMILLVMKSIFHLYIGAIKFSSLFQESPCSPVVTFPSIGAEGHGGQPCRETPFCHILFSSIFFFYSYSYSNVKKKNKNKTIKKGHKTCLAVK